MNSNTNNVISLVVVILVVICGGLVPHVSGETALHSPTFTGSQLCTLPCNILNPFVWNNDLLGSTSIVTVSPLTDVKLFLKSSLVVNSLTLGGGSGAVTLDIKADAKLAVTAGFNLAVGSVVNVYGELVVNGLASIEGTINVFAGGKINFAAAVDVKAGAIVTIGKAGIVTCISNLNVHVGASVAVSVNATLNLNIGGRVDGQLVLRGILSSDATITVNGVLRAYASARLEINSGSLIISVGATVSLQGANCVGVDIKVLGVLNLSISARVTLSGKLTAGFGGKVIVGSNCFLNIGGMLVINGELSVAASAQLDVALSVNVVGKLNIAGSAIVTLSSDVTISGQVNVLVGAQLSLKGSVIVSGYLSLNGAICNADAIVTVRGGGSLVLAASASVQLKNGINVEVGASVNVGKGTLLVLLANSQIDGSLVVALDATLKIAAGITTCTVPLTIRGTVEILSTLDLGLNAYIQFSGNLNLVGPKCTLIASTITIKDGATLIGTGRLIAALVRISGICNVLSSLNITGDCVFDPTSSLVAHISGLNVFSKILVSGSVTIDGNVNAIIEGGYCPSLSTVFRIIKADSVQGTFDGLTSSPAILEARVNVASVVLVAVGSCQ